MEQLTQLIDTERWLEVFQTFVLPRLIQTGLQILGATVALYAFRWLSGKIHTHLASRTRTLVDDILSHAVRGCGQISIGFWAAMRIAQIWDLGGLADTLVAVWIVVFSFPVSKFATDLLEIAEAGIVGHTGSKLDDTALPWVNRLARIAIIGGGVMMAMNWLGVSITPLLAGASVVGLAFSFAAKDTLSNLIAGILLIIDRPFQVGDRIELWGGLPSQQATWGDVKEIGLRATVIETPDKLTVIIPNSAIMQRDIVNYTASGPLMRLRIPIGVAYDADIDLAKRLAVQVAEGTEGVLESPKPVAIVRSFGDSAVDLQLRVWLSDARKRRDIGDVITDRLKTVFDENGVEIPYPKRDLYIKSMPQELGAATGVGPAATPRIDHTAESSSEESEA